MKTQIPIGLLSDISELDTRHFMPTDALELVGKAVANWLLPLLESLGADDATVIKGTVDSRAILEGPIFVGEGAHIEPTAFIQGPCYIGAGAEVRHGAYIRGNVYVGAGAVVGHTTEVKGSTLLDGAKAAHFAYVGDSLLCRNVNLGAGTKLANLKLAKSDVKVKHPADNRIVSSGLKKLGALIGDGAQTGCNAVLSPGSILLPGAMVMPCEHFHGTRTKR